MSANSFGRHFQVTSFGESHGPALGAVIEGCPAGVPFDEALLIHSLERRRPGLHASHPDDEAGQAVSSRQEPDLPEILSGLFEGRTLGTPICVIVRNLDIRSSDYDLIRDAPRAGHADDVWQNKFGLSDHRGGGRSSGRETLSRVIGGAFAQMFLQASEHKVPLDKRPKSICVKAMPTQIGSIAIYDFEKQKTEIYNYLSRLKTEGESVGGIAEIRVENPPKSLGQPVFHKLKSDLAAAYMSIGAVTGVELGGGFALADRTGTAVHANANATAAEVYGGIRGGISTGETLILRAAFKPTSSILDIAKKGRHDPCIVLRALPVLEAMTYLVLADHVLWSRLDRV